MLINLHAINKSGGKKFPYKKNRGARRILQRLKTQFWFSGFEPQKVLSGSFYDTF